MPNNDLTNLAPINYKYSQDLTSEQKIQVKENIGITYGNTLPQSADDGDIFLYDVDDSTALSNIGAVSYKYSQTLSSVEKDTVVNNIHKVIDITNDISVNISSGNATAAVYKAYFNGYGVNILLEINVTQAISDGQLIEGTVTIPNNYAPLLQIHDANYCYSSCIVCQLSANGSLEMRVLYQGLSSGNAFYVNFNYLV